MGVAGSNRRGGGAGSSRGGASGRGASGDGASGRGASPGSSSADSFRVTIPSDFNSGRDVQERILADVQRHGFSSDNTFAIRIALEEAMVNAIKHGNRLDPGKKVHIASRVSPKRVEITIEDEGPGFDRSAIPNPTIDDNLERPSGRGILLIEAYMDGVHWSRGGRRLRMVKENAS